MRTKAGDVVRLTEGQREALRRAGDEHMADLHAASDWRSGMRWACPCGSCAVARRRGYEPRSTAQAMLGGGS